MSGHNNLPQDLLWPQHSTLRVVGCRLGKPSNGCQPIFWFSLLPTLQNYQKRRLRLVTLVVNETLRYSGPRKQSGAAECHLTLAKLEIFLMQEQDGSIP